MLLYIYKYTIKYIDKWWPCMIVAIKDDSTIVEEQWTW